MKNFNVLFCGEHPISEDTIGFFAMRSKTIECETRGEAVSLAWEGLAKEEEFKHCGVSRDHVQSIVIDNQGADVQVIPLFLQCVRLMDEKHSFYDATERLSRLIDQELEEDK